MLMEVYHENNNNNRMMGWWAYIIILKKLFSIPLSQIEVFTFIQCLCFQISPMHGSRRWFKWLDSCYPSGRPELSSVFPDAFPCQSWLLTVFGNIPEDRSSALLCLPLSLYLLK